MNIVTIGVSSIEETQQRLEAAFRGEPQGQHISFESMELLWRILTPKKWELLKLITGSGPMTIRETARRAGEDGRVIFPYDAIHVDFTITKAA